jgi:hypothetical protein
MQFKILIILKQIKIHNNVLKSSNCYASTALPTDSTDQNDSMMAARIQVTLTPVDPPSVGHGESQVTYCL